MSSGVEPTAPEVDGAVPAALPGEVVCVCAVLCGDTTRGNGTGGLADRPVGATTAS